MKMPVKALIESKAPIKSVKVPMDLIDALMDSIKT